MSSLPPNYAAASAEAISACNNLCYESLVETCDLAGSYARSAAEAAWHGDKLTVDVSVHQLRLCTIEAIRLFKSLDASGEIGRAT
jgi:hypothetical protein